MKNSKRNIKNELTKAERGYSPGRYALKMQAERQAANAAAREKAAMLQGERR